MPIVRDQPTIHGNEIFIQQKSVCATLKKQTRGNSESTTPQNSKRMQKFCRYGEFSEYVLPRATKILKPIYDLTRKGRPFNWGKEQQDSFEEIKCRLMKPQVLYMPNKTGRFHLYSDTSKFATGSTLYQIQNGKPKLIAYTSKRLKEAAKSYSLTELELCGLAINIASFFTLT